MVVLARLFGLELHHRRLSQRPRKIDLDTPRSRYVGAGGGFVEVAYRALGTLVLNYREGSFNQKKEDVFPRLKPMLY